MGSNDSGETCSWTYSNPALPDGLSINPGAGLISGCVSPSEPVGLTWSLQWPSGPASPDHAADADQPFVVGPDAPTPDPDRQVRDKERPNGERQP